jgi:flagellar protein FlaI
MIFGKKAAPKQPMEPKPDKDSERVSKLTDILKRRQKPQAQRKEYPKFAILAQKITPLEVGAKEAVYPLLRPYAYASIKYDPKDGALIYSVIEPQLSDEERKFLARIKEGLIQILDVSLGTLKNDQKILELLENKIHRLIAEFKIAISDDQYLRIMYYIYRDFVGLNELEPLLRDPYIEDIACDGTNVPLYVVHQRFGQLKTNVSIQPDEYIKEFVVKLAERCDRYVSYAEPLLDGSLPDGTRVQASLAGDVTTHGPTFSVRKFRENPFTPVDQFNMKTVDLDMLAYMWFLIEHGANILVCGATATGKTSFLNSLAFFMPPTAKVVSIEDTREINIYHENWLPAVARIGFAGTRVGEVTMYDLLKEAFRQNPNYLIVGEVRGEEAAVMFQAMASGITSMSTMHAGSIEDALKRLQTRPISLPPTLLETLDVVIIMAHAIEKGASARRVRNIIEVESVDPETARVKYTTAYEWNPVKDVFTHKKDSVALRRISGEQGIALSEITKELEQRKRVLAWLAAQPLDWKAVSEYIILYYRDREAVLKLIAQKTEKPAEKMRKKT